MSSRFPFGMYAVLILALALSGCWRWNEDGVTQMPKVIDKSIPESGYPRYLSWRNHPIHDDHALLAALMASMGYMDSSNLDLGRVDKRALKAAINRLHRELGMPKSDYLRKSAWLRLATQDPLGERFEKELRVLSRKRDHPAARWAQGILRRIGFFNGSASSRIDKETRTALRAFQRKAGLSETGIIDAPTYLALAKRQEGHASVKHVDKTGFDTTVTSLSRSLSSGAARSIPLSLSDAKPDSHSDKPPASPPASTPASEEGSVESDAEVLKAQNILKRLKYDPGSADGKLGAKTKAALAEFQRNQGLPPTGSLDPRTRSALRATISKPRRIPGRKTPSSKDHKLEFVVPKMPGFSLGEGMRVLVIEHIDCKSKDEAWVLLYGGAIREKAQGTVTIGIDKRLGLWFDRRETGIHSGEWWCEPRRRYCFGEVEFSRWKGRFKSGDKFNAKSDLVIPEKFGPVPLAGREIGKRCISRR
uniref:Peptidoglycan-binding (PGRP) domain of peptidoglycan hydrolases-containing protein n=1 Tax=Candidatus Kentrum sp. UNK TaxID=2126344 RepID=A0A451AIU1_9GAMM|nr:MAG: Peptidoglycan-binding (PGRP) domain of peptidoglycan hydrolases-containing protein [Candidatus Kentron sp. UNK]VFK70599.1 MAG: Peptidoglycan-binding (PGRP) domain of peptidoglycan hydrolases-containing protein [Candidatus Kentron sp. UNK]